MAIKKSSFATLLATVAATGAVLAAPSASAAAPTTSATSPNTSQSCTSATTRSVCQSPGNVQMNAYPPPVKFHPYGGLHYLLGGNK